MIRIPTQALNSYEIEATLDGIAYTLRLDWNAEAQMWTMAVGRLGSDSLRGVVLVPDAPLLRNFHYLEAVPPGEFVAVTGDPREQVGRDNFDLYYIPADEYAAL